MGFTLTDDGHRQPDVPAWCELHSVVEQLHQDLAQHGGVPAHGADVLGRIEAPLEPLVGATRLEGDGDFIEQTGEIEVGWLHLVGLPVDLGHVENALDEVRQIGPGHGDLLDSASGLGGKLRQCLENLGVTDDGVQRCAQLVPHICQKDALGAIRPGRFFGGLARRALGIPQCLLAATALQQMDVPQ